MRRETLPSPLPFPLKTLRLSPLDRKVTDVPRVEGRTERESEVDCELRTTLKKRERLSLEILLRLSESQDCPTWHILTSFLGRIDDSSFRAKCKFPMPSLLVKIYLPRLLAPSIALRTDRCFVAHGGEPEGEKEKERNVGCDCNSIPLAAPRSSPSPTSPVRPFAFVFAVGSLGRAELGGPAIHSVKYR